MASAQRDVVDVAVRRLLEEVGQRRVFIGFSGGLDSAVLLHACARWYAGLRTDSAAGARSGREPPCAIHVDHGLHAEATEWQAHCAAYAASLQVEFVTHTVDVDRSGNVEANARRARYEVFARVVPRGGILLLAHHADDQLETRLLRFLQGRGLMSMPQLRRSGEMDIYRPLLECTRRELMAYARAEGVSWIDDPSNSDTDLDRNFLRHEILPKLVERWSDLSKRVARQVRDAEGVRAALDAVTGHCSDIVPLADIPQQQDAAVAWLRSYLKHRGVFQVTDAALADFWRSAQERQAARLEVQAVWHEQGSGRGLLLRKGSDLVYRSPEGGP